MWRSEDDISKMILNWKIMEKKLRGRSRKMWLDIEEENLERLGV